MDDLNRQAVQDQLTQRELEILRLITDGLSNQEIAEKLFISLGTVKWYLKQIYGKLHVGSRTQAIAAARAAGLLDVTSAVVEQASPPHNLPHQPTPFIGRSRELAAMARHLADPACQLLTVVGPGGIGKTRLALQAAEPQIEVFAQGVYFVSLAPLSALETIVPTIAEAVRFSFYGSADPKQQLLNFLRAKRLLLVLDNFEHLLAGVGMVSEILQTAPRVKILATSRERLNVDGEIIFRMEGMDFPDSEALDDASQYGAVKLFLQGTYRVQPDFVLDAENLKYAARICRLVQGMPLGILLAAAWVGVLSVQEIAQEIQHSLDFLATDQRDMPERQRSLRAAFHHSWKLLSDEERATFKRLSVFRGSFTREAARQVVEMSLKVLMGLVNKSLLWRDSVTGRYEIHQLLRQYGEEQLNASLSESEHIEQRHCAYYAAYMQRQWTAIMSLNQGAVLDEIGLDFNNVFVAWNYATRTRRLADLNRMALGLWYFCDLRRRRDGDILFSQAVAVLQSAHPEEDAEILLGFMLAVQGRFRRFTEFLHGKSLLENSIVILRRHACPEPLVFALESLALMNGLVLGHFTEASPTAQEGLAIAQEHQIHWLIGRCLLHLGLAAQAQGDFVQARRLGEEVWKVCEAVGDVWYLGANAIFLLGAVAVNTQDYAEAERQFGQAFQYYTQIGHFENMALSCSRLGKVAILTRDYGKARSWLQKALGYVKTSGLPQRYYEPLYDLSKLLGAQGNKEDAVELLALLQYEISAMPLEPNYQSVRDVVNASLTQFQGELPVETYTAALERGKTLDLEAVVSRVLSS